MKTTMHPERHIVVFAVAYSLIYAVKFLTHGQGKEKEEVKHLYPYSLNKTPHTAFNGEYIASSSAI